MKEVAMRRTTVRLLMLLLVAAAVLPVVTATSAVAGGSCHFPATDGPGISVKVEGLCFGPTVLRIKPGQKVTWTNHDPFAHTVTGLGFQWASNGDLNQGESFTALFTKPGVYPYSCTIHPGMVGAVVVSGKVTSNYNGSGVQALPGISPRPVVAAQPAPVVARTGRAIWPFGLALVVALLLGGGLLLRNRWSERRLRQPAA
jgi:plastocyanin